MLRKAASVATDISWIKNCARCNAIKSITCVVTRIVLSASKYRSLALYDPGLGLKASYIPFIHHITTLCKNPNRLLSSTWKLMLRKSVIALACRVGTWRVRRFWKTVSTICDLVLMICPKPSKSASGTGGICTRTGSRWRYYELRLYMR